MLSIRRLSDAHCSWPYPGKDEPGWVKCEGQISRCTVYLWQKTKKKRGFICSYMKLVYLWKTCLIHLPSEHIISHTRNSFSSVLSYSNLQLHNALSSRVIGAHAVSSSSPATLLPVRVIFQVAASSQPWVYTLEWIIQAGHWHSLHHWNWVTLFRCNPALSQSSRRHNTKITASA